MFIHDSQASYFAQDVQVLEAMKCCGRSTLTMAAHSLKKEDSTCFEGENTSAASEAFYTREDRTLQLQF